MILKLFDEKALQNLTLVVFRSASLLTHIFQISFHIFSQAARVNVCLCAHTLKECSKSFFVVLSVK
ncbi:CLUMA_CG006063, isoform A [Clunio marinus]|uniref:CLUMA_CG006063, isoform A n=1 Tax=Clunio marinus TaxID=568069 RepID=A0A1J1HWJ1_9DIPT|nr:CLUMA_CG006063, isoform A [Clunio marinus]